MASLVDICRALGEDGDRRPFEVRVDGAAVPEALAVGIAGSGDLPEVLARGRAQGLPVMVAAPDEEGVAVLERLAGPAGGVLLGYAGPPERVRRLVGRGFFLAPDPGDAVQRAVIEAYPVDRMVLASAALAAGPAGLGAAVEALAAAKGLTPADVARVTAHGARVLLGLGAAPEPSRIAYPIRRSLYLNVTNRCSNGCVFCSKFRDWVVKGHRLELEREPDVEEVKAAIGDPTVWEEVVFCGYGEPLLRLELVLALSGWLTGLGVPVRVNTDGQANLVHGRDVLPELAGRVQALSVSLNAPDPATYQRLCRSPFGEAAFEGVLAFLREAPRHVSSVTATVVALPGVDVEACRRLATSLGVGFRSRAYQEVG